ncbi:hypothetical protein CRYUN_Cryun14cG0139000 [Craigia yunnanensis]
MKQKMLIKVTMNDHKSRSKAFKTVAGLSGVESFSLKGESQIEVTGDGVDPVQLTSLLRKSMRHAELVSVSVEGGEKKEEKKEVKPPAAYVWTPYNQPNYGYEVPSYGYAQHHGPSWSIM